MNGLQDIYTIFQFSLTPGMFIKNLVVAFVCGVAIARFYHWSTRSPNAARTFMTSLIPLTMITAVVMLVIGNNLARAFGLVGAMSIVRFRTAVKDVQDIVFIFFSLAIGMAAGIGLPMIAFFGTAGIGLVTLGIGRMQAFSDTKRDYLLQFSFNPASGEEAPYLTVLGKYCVKHQLINMKLIDGDHHVELSFYIRFKDRVPPENLVRDLAQFEDVKNVNLFFDEE